MNQSKNNNKSIFFNANNRELDSILQVKNNIINAMINTFGNVSEVCKQMNISRQTFYNYYNNDIEFKEQIDDIKNIALDFVESKLIGKIKEGDIVAILFYLKTQGKKRGYIERVENEITIQQPVVIDWSEPVQEVEEVKAIEIREDNKENESNEEQQSKEL
jgi:ACT domain-containing protein